MVILHYNQLKLHQTMPIVSFMHQLIRAVRRIFSPGGSKAYMPKKSQISRIINDILKKRKYSFLPHPLCTTALQLIRQVLDSILFMCQNKFEIWHVTKLVVHTNINIAFSSTSFRHHVLN